MKRLLIRIVVIACGFVALLFGVHFIAESLRQPAQRPSHDNSFVYAQHVESVIENFNALPTAGRDAVLSNMREWLRDSPERAFQQLDQASSSIVCLGERHNELTRRFITERVIGLISPRTLMLEATAAEVKALVDAMHSPDVTPPLLLEAEILPLLRAASQHRSELTIHGIEPDSAQSDREQQITRNFIRHFRAEGTTAVLYGALHCQRHAGWFLGELLATPGFHHPPTLSVLIAGASDSGQIQAFRQVARQLGFTGDTLMLDLAHARHVFVQSSFEILWQSLAGYDVVLIFDVI